MNLWNMDYNVYFVSLNIVLYGFLVDLVLFLASGCGAVPYSIFTLQEIASLEGVTLITFKHYQVVVLDTRLC